MIRNWNRESPDKECIVAVGSATCTVTDEGGPSALLCLHHRQPFNPASVIANPMKNNGRPMNTRRMLNISMKPVIQIADPTPTKMTRSKKSGPITSGRDSWRTRSSGCMSPPLSVPSHISSIQMETRRDSLL
jgi:hypothetical protein